MVLVLRDEDQNEETLGLVIIGLAAVLSLRAWEFNERHPRTDDAVSRANIIGIAPRVSGPIIKINVSDNQFVKGGDLPIDNYFFKLAIKRLTNDA